MRISFVGLINPVGKAGSLWLQKMGLAFQNISASGEPKPSLSIAYPQRWTQSSRKCWQLQFFGEGYMIFKAEGGVSPSIALIPSVDMVGDLSTAKLPPPQTPQQILIIDPPGSIGTGHIGPWITGSLNEVYTVVITGVGFAWIHLRIPRSPKFCLLMFYFVTGSHSPGWLQL